MTVKKDLSMFSILEDNLFILIVLILLCSVTYPPFGVYFLGLLTAILVLMPFLEYRDRGVVSTRNKLFALMGVIMLCSVVYPSFTVYGLGLTAFVGSLVLFTLYREYRAHIETMREELRKTDRVIHLIEQSL